MVSRAQPPLYRWRLFQPPGKDIMWIQCHAVTTGRSAYGENMRLLIRCWRTANRWEARICVHPEPIARIVPSHYGGARISIPGITENRGVLISGRVLPNNKCMVLSSDAYRIAKLLTDCEQKGSLELRLQLPGCHYSQTRGRMDDYTGRWNIKGVGAAVARMEQLSGRSDHPPA